MIVTVAKYHDRIPVEMPEDAEAAEAKISVLVGTHGAGAVFIDGVSVASINEAKAKEAERQAALKAEADAAEKAKADADPTAGGQGAGDANA